MVATASDIEGAGRASTAIDFRTRLFIDGQFVDAASGRTFSTENPANGQELTRVAEGDAADVDAAVAAGVDPANVIIDPGLGFAKTAEHNWALLRALPEFVGTGVPVLVGASRKRFLGSLLAGPGGEPRPPDGRETATAVISALAGFIRPETSSELNVAVANWGTFAGAVCFAIGGLMQAFDLPAT